ncbi:hypothetical protein [Dissulfuribacter thermophilus]|uniref:hypothetical protein n=1 Tax=Dissulfuribacter thermophilus TaxID=1156395 RepID=UPI000833E2A7|nr:hypothetical protein [Dissulfuribacter thermophilus]
MKSFRDVLLIGQDHPIEEKIRCAKGIYEELSLSLSEAPDIVNLLRQYDEAIEATWNRMNDVGVTRICTVCATQDGGSCCGSGIEKRFDVTLLIINLMMGVSLPERPWDDTGCWFLGPRGCTIRARHTICVNYICKRLNASIAQSDLHTLQEAIAREVELGFFLEEKIKRMLMS